MRQGIDVLGALHERHRDHAIKRADHKAVDQKLDQKLGVHAVAPDVRCVIAGLDPAIHCLKTHFFGTE